MDSWAKDLNDWADLMADQVGNLMIYQLNSLFSIRKLPLHTPLLQAAARCWDHDLHVFRFNHEELCPTFEEFSRILEIDLGRNPAIPDAQDWYFKDLIALSGLSKVHASKILQAHHTDFAALIRHFNSPGDLRDPNFQTYRNGVFCLCMMAQFLFHDYEDGRDDVLVNVALQVGRRHNPMVLCLAETFHGLDRVTREGVLFISGSPYLLQLWLIERLQLAPHPVSSIRMKIFHPGRTILLLHSTADDWYTWMQKLTPSALDFNGAWYSATRSVFSLGQHAWVWLIGLRTSSYYFPNRIMRQFGHPQEVLTGTFPRPPLNTLTRKTALNFRKYWEARKFIKHNYDRVDNGLPDDYMLESIQSKKRKQASTLLMDAPKAKK